MYNGRQGTVAVKRKKRATKREVRWSWDDKWEEGQGMENLEEN